MEVASECAGAVEDHRRLSPLSVMVSAAMPVSLRFSAISSADGPGTVAACNHHDRDLFSAGEKRHGGSGGARLFRAAVPGEQI